MHQVKILISEDHKYMSYVNQQLHYMQYVYSICPEEVKFKKRISYSHMGKFQNGIR